MNLTSEQIERFMRLLEVTRERELNCNECLDHVAEFAEFRLAGAEVPEALEAVEHHLSICAECREEYEVLRDALKGLDEDGS